MKTDSYYSDNSRVSNSAIGWFLKSPKYFRMMMDGKIAGYESQSMSFGTALHMAILQPEEFKKTYRIADFEIPRLGQQKLFCEEFIKNREKGPVMASKMAYERSYSTKGKSDNKVKEEAIAMLMRYKNYIQQCSGRQFLSWAQLNKINRLKNAAMKHKFAKKLLEMKGDCEFQINWEHCGVQCKSLLDKLVIDDKNKEIYLVDLKTTSHINGINGFRNACDEYGYFRQIQFYKMAIEYLVDNGFYLHNFSEYKFYSYIIAFDTTDTERVEVYDMSNEERAAEELEVIESSLTRIKWHIDNDEWEHDKEYYEGDGINWKSIKA